MDPQQPASAPALEPKVRDFYLHSLELLDRSKVPYVVGGGYAMACYTGIIRHTKDLDVFIKPRDLDRVLDVFRAAGHRTERTWPHFLAKALEGESFVDILYNSSNGLCPVDDAFFDNAVAAEVLGRGVRLCPVEEMIWTKAFVQSRDRFDGADIQHLVRARAQLLDWPRLRGRFRGHEQVLLGHLVLFSYIYPAEHDGVPGELIDELLASARSQPETDQRICRGTFLSNDQYLFDVTVWGYKDARLKPLGPLTMEQIATISPIKPPQ